jgi:hypothetical protein
MTMQSFEDVRSELAARYPIDDNEPYLLSCELRLSEGRRQRVFIAELETESGDRVLRVGTPVAPLGALDPVRCLRFNWAQRVGYLAVSDLDSVPYLQLCENRPYGTLDAAGLEQLLVEVASQADSLEQLLGQGRDLV